MQFNLLAVLVAALVTLPIGFLWYNPSTLLKPWLSGIGKTSEQVQPKNMIIHFLLVIVLAFIVAFSLQFHVIHQFHVGSLMMTDPVAFNDPNSAVHKEFMAFMADKVDNFRTFKHGALHGTITGLLFVLPIIAINSMFERRSFRTIMITAGYWVVTLAIMGGIISAWPLAK